MNKQAREALDAYYVEAGSWAEDRQEELRKSRKTAWTIALISAAVALLLALALIVLLPLKTVEPYVLTVDKQTGFVQALEPLDPERLSGDAALTQSFLTQYVIARESFNADALQADYRRVALWSADTARSSYIAGQQASNPDSPLARYPRTTVVETIVKSVSPMPGGANVMMVRFNTVRRDAGGQVQPPQAWVAVIRYRYSGAPMRLEDRLINPLGFEVLHYQRNAEALPPEPAAAPLAETTIKPVVVVPAQQQPAQQAPQQPAQQPPAQPRGPEVEL
jgi:type IV secretion system protein VirB8